MLHPYGTRATAPSEAPRIVSDSDLSASIERARKGGSHIDRRRPTGSLLERRRASASAQLPRGASESIVHQLNRARERPLSPGLEPADAGAVPLPPEHSPPTPPRSALGTVSAPASPATPIHATASPSSLPGSTPPQRLDSPRAQPSDSSWSRALSAFSMLSVYGRGSTTLPVAPVVADNEQLYPHRLCGFLRNQDNTKLAPEEEIILRLVIPTGRFLVQVISSQKDGTPADELLFESELSSKTSPMDRSDHEVRFEIPEGQHAIVHLQVKNTGQWGWRGCKGSLFLRSNTDLSGAVEKETSLEQLLQNFNVDFGPQLLPGEVFLAMVSPICHTQRRAQAKTIVKVIGTLFITNYQLIFVPNRPSDSRLPYMAATDPRTWRVPHGLVQKIDWNVQTQKREGSGTEKDKDKETELWNAKIHLRTPCCIKLRTLAACPPHTNLKGKEISRQLQELLLRLAFPSSPLHIFAFTHGVSAREKSAELGWQQFDLLSEYGRLGLFEKKEWRVSEVNVSYELCDTYPRYLVVPTAVGDDQLKAIAAYRSKGRVPVVVWRHPANGAVLLRCSQPLSGISGTKCQEDINYFETVRLLNTGNPNTLYIFDLRPQMNALGNSIMGKGYEAPSVYKNCRLEFLNIDNIQVMYASYKRLRDLVLSSDSTSRDFTELDWLTHLERILNSAREMATVLSETGASIVTHCSDGWDRTSQVCALVQLFLDPYARTFKGFVALVEKEWLSFGHQFAKRIGTGPESEESYLSSFVGERGPIFLQFLDCLFQLSLQYPTAFEFNEQFLRYLLHHLYAGCFGTFLGNNDRERRQWAVATKTISVWSILDLPDALAPMRNPTYDDKYGALAALPQKPQFWSAYYSPPVAHSFE